VQCAACSLAFVVNPQTEKDVLEQYSRGASSKLAYYRLSSPADAKSFNGLLDVVERYASKGRILDVGCNIGTFVRVAGQRGWQAVGVDVNVEAVDYGRHQRDVDLLTLDEFEARPELAFDVIHSSDTIEHFTDPSSVVRSYVQRLAPGGVLIASTPNYDSRLCKIFQLKPTEHLYLFNQRSLEFMLRSIGLEVVDMLLFDRFRNISAMFESTTFDNLPPAKWAFKILHQVRPELKLRLNGGENIVAVARLP
jgi:2-polyprenyl-3-methyl-5-hydroxy-6-metoxy-1,4-benzoquinol methylase